MTNILLLNLLIAVFNAIFMHADKFSHEIWKFNRFGVVMEYEQKPALPPPLIIFSHIYLIIKWCRRRTKGHLMLPLACLCSTLLVAGSIAIADWLITNTTIITVFVSITISLNDF